MKKKSIYPLLLVMSMLLALLSGCAARKTKDAKAEVKPAPQESVLLGAYHYNPDGSLAGQTYWQYDEQHHITQMTEKTADSTVIYNIYYNEWGNPVHEVQNVVDDPAPSDAPAPSDTPDGGSDGKAEKTSGAGAFNVDYEYDENHMLLRIVITTAEGESTSDIERSKGGQIARLYYEKEESVATVFSVDVQTRDYTVEYIYTLEDDGGFSLALRITDHPDVPEAVQRYDKEGSPVETFDPSQYDEEYAEVYLWGFALFEQDKNQVPISCGAYAEFILNTPEQVAENEDGASLTDLDAGAVVDLPEDTTLPEDEDGSMKLIYGDAEADADALLAQAEEAESEDAEPEAPEQEPEASETPALPDWSEAYRHYVLDEAYRTESGDTFYTDSEIRFALYDIDRDGTPELLITNGTSIHAGATTYAYTYNGSVVALGTIGNYPESIHSAPGTGFPGLFTMGGNMGYFTYHYYSLSGVTLQRQEVATTDYNNRPDDDPLYEQLTDDAALYDACWVAFDDPWDYSDANALSLRTLGEINSMGWTSFTAGF